ncbi:O-antigen ligase family protein [Marivirga sp. S37H4]|uniref:O-antigen ligase family protein n=1 Tax=Marivirga aurantiaca TaxID=2802615 RepID=A0A935CA32_9BACT|nr:O-antigen ligase family protein [Marivirga aurantiaca]MBK6266531.1 O-antigen ligase family protein [Marivirga aurantiaca]
MISLDRKKILLLLFLLMVSVAIPFIMVQTTYMVAPFIILTVLSIFVVGLTLANFQFGVYLLFIYGCSMFVLGKIINVHIPYGIAYDLIILLTFLSTLVNARNKKGFQWKTNEPIVIIQFIFYAYFILQIANPNAVSIAAWVTSARFMTLFLLFYVFIHFFENKKRVAYFNVLWMSIAMLVASYGLFQEYFGLRDFEWKWLRADPNRLGLYYVWGHMRVFSFLSDPSAYGLFLGFCGLATLMMGFGPFSIARKSLYFGMTMFMFYAMSFSGTRTAYAMVAVGIVLFIVANLRNPKILAGSSVLVLIFIILMVGPFYSGPIKRMRSTFEFEGDASMAVRDAKRIRLQAYVKTHPIGGGLNTAGNSGLALSRGHPLAGNYDPDSGYLRTALEMGWIGLLIAMSLNLAIVIKGIKNYFNLKDSLLKTYSIMYIVPFLGLSVAHYAQDALFQKPINILVIATYALMIKLQDIDEMEET